jgi:hypothetical protein
MTELQILARPTGSYSGRVSDAITIERESHMITRRKLAASLGGLTLMLGTVGGAVAVHAASPQATAPPAAIVQPAQADTETADGPDTGTAQDQQGQEVQDSTPDAAESTTGSDTDTVQDGSGSQVEDGTPDIAGAVTP